MYQLRLKYSKINVESADVKNRDGYIGVFVPTPRKNLHRPQNHIQFIHPTNLEYVRLGDPTYA